VFISCGSRDRKAYIRRDATMVAEVLSPTTERIDRTEKFHAYTSLPSVLECMLVSQDSMHVELFRRRSNWQREVHASAETISLDSIGQSLPVAEIYRDISV
jgi:Uma2 family endonuclease